MQQKELAKFFPEQRTKADLPDREYFFNVINTTDPDYISAIVKHAHALRYAGKQPQENTNNIEVTDQWVKELKESPFYSSKEMRVIFL